jgi:hypothetical protein
MDFKQGDCVMLRPSLCKNSGRPTGALKFTYIQINYIITFKFVKGGPNIRRKQCLLPLKVSICNEPEDNPRVSKYFAVTNNKT